MQMHRRLEYNFGLQHALRISQDLGKPLLIYEGLRPDYPFASPRYHSFILDGMAEHMAFFQQRDALIAYTGFPGSSSRGASSGKAQGKSNGSTRGDASRHSGEKTRSVSRANSSATYRDSTGGFSGSNYYLPFVPQTKEQSAGFLKQLGEQACAVVSDEFPVFIVPEQNARLAGHLKERSIPFHTVDSNGIIPLQESESDPYSAYLFRKILQKKFSRSYEAFPEEAPLLEETIRGQLLLEDLKVGELQKTVIQSSLELLEKWRALNENNPGNPAAVGKSHGEVDRKIVVKKTELLKDFPLDFNVPAISVNGSRAAALNQMKRFVESMSIYESDRNNPDSNATSGLSPYLHFGKISAHELVSRIFDTYGLQDSVKALIYNNGSKGFFPGPPEVDSFLDEVLTWRETGYHFCFHRKDYDKFDSLPDWARKTLLEHSSDERPYLYSLEQLEAAETHDEIWNAAQRELKQTGRIHNYLRMLWGKKILEWSKDPREGLEIALHLNNKYSIDGRNPNSYSGVFWIFGRFDRPWQERPIFGKIRYMSSEQTKKKVQLKNYLQMFGPQQQGTLL
tara:strand:- start:5915 stop:7612 length:1698 start_codon:yes stop_codon:yes gene_type:complete